MAAEKRTRRKFHESWEQKEVYNLNELKRKATVVHVEVKAKPPVTYIILATNCCEELSNRNFGRVSSNAPFSAVIVSWYRRITANLPVLQKVLNTRCNKTRFINFYILKDRRA